MTRPCSEDIRERRLWRELTRGNSSFHCRGAPDQPFLRDEVEESERGYWRPVTWPNRRPQERVLSANADWLRKRIRSGPFTLHKLTQGLAARGTKTGVRAVWTFVHRRAQLQKKRFYQHSRIVPTSPVSGPAGKHIKAG